MLHTLLASTAAAALLLAASQAHAEDLGPEAAMEAQAPDMNFDFGPWGVALDELDPQVEPGNDFFAHVNGQWTTRTQIPSYAARFGNANALHEKSIDDIKALVTQLVAANPAPGTIERRIVDAYNAYADLAAIDATGLAPAYPFLAEIFTAPDLARLTELFAMPGYPALVSGGVTVDSKNPDNYIVSIGFGGMGLPDRDYYLVDSDKNLEIRAKYKEYLEFLLGKAGYADPRSAAASVYAFEHKVALLEWDRRLLRQDTLTYNSLTRAELLALAPDFPVARLLEAGGFADQEVFLASQIPPTEAELQEAGLSAQQAETMIGEGLPGMMAMLTKADLPTLKAWMAARFLNDYASRLSSELDQASFDFNSRTLYGLEEQRDRSERGIAAVESQLGEQLGALYVERHFPPEAKASMNELVGNLLLAMGEFVDGNQWMTPETREEARAKLSTFITLIGYPDEFETYDGLEILSDDPLGNAVRATAWSNEDSRQDLGKKVDKSEWLMVPQTVNAYYAPNFNQIAFPAAFLQPPFFNLQADKAVNYGAIGSVIGHEIGHGFDDSGSRYDASGALRNWWQSEDRAYFDAQADKLKMLIEQYCPIEESDGTLCLKGDLAIGETLGDVVGLQMAYRAYRLSLGQHEAPVIDGMTGDQRFLLGFAQNWRSKMRPEYLRQQVLSGVHPPAEFRLNNAVRHLDAWYEAFGVGPEHALYLPPDERVQIWK